LLVAGVIPFYVHSYTVRSQFHIRVPIYLGAALVSRYDAFVVLLVWALDLWPFSWRVSPYILQDFIRAVDL
jgi:hypothetical protein